MEQKNPLFYLKHDSDIVIFKGFGIWKPAISKQCIAAITEAVAMLESDFALIIDTSEVKSLTPQCFMAWEDALDSWIGQGLTYSARIDKPEASFYKVFLPGFDDILRIKTTFCSAATTNYALKSLHQSGFSGFVQFDDFVEQALAAKEQKTAS